MKIALAQINYHIGNFESNSSKIIETIKKAEQQNSGDTKSRRNSGQI